MKSLQQESVWYMAYPVLQAVLLPEKYKEAEIHLCNNEKSPELMEVHKTLENLLDTKIKVQKGQESRVVVPSQIIRIWEGFVASI